MTPVGVQKKHQPKGKYGFRSRGKSRPEGKRPGKLGESKNKMKVLPVTRVQESSFTAEDRPNVLLRMENRL